MINFHISRLDISMVFFTVLVLLFSVNISIEDIRFGKIRNKKIVSGLFAGSLFYGGFFILSRVSPNGSYVTLIHIQRVIVNSVLALLCGYLLWKSGVWSAGDSKLFFLFAFLLPLEYYGYGYMDYFPAFNLLINIFVVSFLAVFVKVVGSVIKRVIDWKSLYLWSPSDIIAWYMKAKSFIEKQWPMLIIMFAIFNAVSMGVRFVDENSTRSELKLFMNVGSMIFMFTAVGWISSKGASIIERFPIVRKAVLIFMTIFILSISTFAIEFGRQLASGLKMVIGFMAVIGITRKFIDFHLNLSDVKLITVSEIDTGMVLSPETVRALPKEAVTETFFMDGLTEDAIRDIQESLPPDYEIEITTTIPFAPLASLGVVLTILTQQSVVHLAIKLLR